MNMANKAAATYKSIGVESIVSAANPHELISLLFTDISLNLSMWEYHLENNNIPEKAECVNKTIKVLTGLQACLDFKTGGELANNLDELYGYCIKIIFRGNATQDISLIKEAGAVVKGLQEAWDSIPPAFSRRLSSTTE